MPVGCGGYAACTSPKHYSGLSEGSHSFQVRATDGAGNTDPTPASYTWTVDTVAPNTTIDSSPSDPSGSAAASFSFSSSESGSTFECKLDAEAFAACTSPKDYSGLSEGSHSFQVAPRMGGQHRPHPGQLHLDGRYGRTQHHDRQLAARSVGQRCGELQLQQQRERLDV